MLKISILTPIYGVEKYIEQCARSLFEQSYASIEYIFVDDCTHDKSIGILQSHSLILERKRCKNLLIRLAVKARGSEV